MVRPWLGVTSFAAVRPAAPPSSIVRLFDGGWWLNTPSTSWPAAFVNHGTPMRTLVFVNGTEVGAAMCHPTSGRTLTRLDMLDDLSGRCTVEVLLPHLGTILASTIIDLSEPAPPFEPPPDTWVQALSRKGVRLRARSNVAFTCEVSIILDGSDERRVARFRPLESEEGQVEARVDLGDGSFPDATCIAMEGISLKLAEPIEARRVPTSVVRFGTTVCAFFDLEIHPEHLVATIIGYRVGKPLRAQVLTPEGYETPRTNDLPGARFLDGKNRFVMDLDCFDDAIHLRFGKPNEDAFAEVRVALEALTAAVPAARLD